MVRSATTVMPLQIRMSPLLRRSVLLVGLLLLACGTRESAVVSIALHPSNPKIVYVATNDAVHKTRDGGATWEQFPAFTARRVTTLAIDPKLPATVYAGTMGDAIYKSPDGGQHWVPHNVGLKEHVSFVNEIIFPSRQHRTHLPRHDGRRRSLQKRRPGVGGTDGGHEGSAHRHLHHHGSPSTPRAVCRNDRRHLSQRGWRRDLAKKE